jgi:beta-lactamase superfamily II metal-dependent hydrolase
MKIRIFQSEKGDCLLLQTARGANILVDGGMPEAYAQHVAPFLGQMHKAKDVLDLVYVSHIDQDHIGGILQMLNDLMDWRVYEYRSRHGAEAKLPAAPRPPDIKHIWHNAFSALLQENQRPAEQLLAQVALLEGPADPSEDRRQSAFLAQSVSEAIRVSNRVSAGQLNIPLNREFDGKLIMVREPAGHEATIGGMKLTVIGPFAEDVDILRKEWNDWLRANKAAVAKLRAKAGEDEGLLEEAIVAGGPAMDIALKTLGNRAMVTPPNLASVMLLAEEQGNTLLLTGDGHADDILAGLDFHQRLDAEGRMHVDVLKVQHHLSEHNIHEAFCRRITASHYVFCGNGKHENPDLDALEMLLRTRVDAEDAGPFKLWFNCAGSVAPAGAPRRHMKAVESKVAAWTRKSGNMISSRFLEKSSLAFAL